MDCINPEVLIWWAIRAPEPCTSPTIFGVAADTREVHDVFAAVVRAAKSRGSDRIDRSTKEAGTSLRTSPLLLWWAIRESNPGPTGYEPVALTS